MNVGQAAAPTGALLMRVAGAVVLVAYGVIGVLQDDVVIPTKRGTFHLHGLSGWTMAGAMLCAALALLAVVIDHIDRRDDELAYKRFGKWTARLGWVLTGLAIGLNTAGVNFPEPSTITPIGIFGGVMILAVVSVIGLANERAVERTARPSLQVPQGTRSRYRVGRAILGHGVDLGARRRDWMDAICHTNHARSRFTGAIDKAVQTLACYQDWNPGGLRPLGNLVRQDQPVGRVAR